MSSRSTTIKSKEVVNSLLQTIESYQVFSMMNSYMVSSIASKYKYIKAIVFLQSTNLLHSPENYQMMVSDMSVPTSLTKGSLLLLSMQSSPQLRLP